MKRILVLILGLFAGLSSAYAAKLKVVTTLPDLAHVVEAIGGDEVEVTSLLKGPEDPHFVDAVPEFIRLTSRADIVCQVGLGLESGWIPKVLSKSGNAKVQRGGAGFCEAGRSVKVIDVPTGAVDRSMGDIHPEGNPHYYLSPISLAESGEEIANVLSAAKPASAEKFAKGLEAFRKSMQDTQNKMSAKLKAGLSGKKLLAMEYHKEFAYFFKAYQIPTFGTIEEKPGVPPSAGRLAQIGLDAKKAGVTVALAAQHAPDRSLQKFTELSGVPVKKVPVSAGREGSGAAPLEKLQDALIDAVLSGAVPAPAK